MGLRRAEFPSKCTVKKVFAASENTVSSRPIAFRIAVLARNTITKFVARLNFRLDWPTLLLSTAAIIAAAWWLLPFFDLRVNPAFNSDSGMALVAITEHIPLAENIFQWGSARNGSALSVLGWVFCRLFGGLHLPDFLTITNVLMFVCASCVCVRFSLGRFRNRAPLLLPIGLCLVVPNFNALPSTATFSFTVSDIAHRPEAVPLLVGTCCLLLLLSKPAYRTRSWRIGLIALASVLGIAAAWVTDLALVAMLLFVATAGIRSLVLKRPLAWEGIMVWGSAVAALSFFRSISVSAGEVHQLYHFVDRQSFAQMIGTALLHLASVLTWTTWTVIIVIGLACGAAFVHCCYRRPEELREVLPWQVVALYLAGLAVVTAPLASDWLYKNEIHMRYFSPGALLLCLAAAQGAVWLVQLLIGSGQRLAALVTTALVLLPFALGIKDNISIRQELRAAGPNAPSRAGGVLLASGARAIVGSFWETYCYVVAHPGFLKATPVDPITRLSRSNTLNVLNMSEFAWVARQEAALKPMMYAYGVELQQRDYQPPARLPTGAFFKKYLNTGRLLLEFGSPESRVYLSEGWSGDEHDSTHSWIWAIGRRAVLEVPLKRNATYDLDLACTAAPALGGSQEIKVVCDGKEIGTLSFDSSEHLQRRLSIPFAEGRGPRRIEFFFALSARSRGESNTSGETRPIAAAFEHATFTITSTHP